MNTFGQLFRLSSFGESHGRGIGGVLDGCPPGLTVDLELIRKELSRRRPGQSALSTDRNEADEVELISGIFEGKTTGAPIAFLVRNTDMRSQDYDYLKGIFRPSHADYTYHSKYGIRDHRGGGRSSARETIARVVAGAFAKMLLNTMNISIEAFTSQIGPIVLEQQDSTLFSSELAAENPLHCPDREKAEAMMALIARVKEEQDSVGGVVSCVVRGLPVGWGEPVFGKLHARLASAILSIPACKVLSTVPVSMSAKKAPSKTMPSTLTVNASIPGVIIPEAYKEAFPTGSRFISGPPSSPSPAFVYLRKQSTRKAPP
jgi:chorismate synthase